MPDSSAATRSSTRNKLHIPRAAAVRAVALAHAAVPVIGRFPVPEELAAEAGIEVVPCELLAPHTEIADPSTIWVRPTADQRELGSRIFRGLASTIIGPVRRTRAQVCALAAWLALPPDMVDMAGGLDAAIEEQTRATPSLLRWWGAIL